MVPILLICTATLLGYFAARTVYRLFFHPLAHIPGPWLAAVTTLYEDYYDVVKPGRFVFKIKQLHARYGPIVRVTPREIHINDVDFLSEIYPTSVAHPRDKDPVQMRGINIPLSTAASVDHDEHRRRREVLNPFFSQKNIVAREHSLRLKVVQLCSHLDSAIITGEVRNLLDIYYAFARDVVNQVSFEHESGVLDSLEGAATLRTNLTRLLFGTKVVKRFPRLFQLLRYLPARLADRLKSEGVKDMTKLAMSIKHLVHSATVEPSTIHVDSHDNSIAQTQRLSLFQAIWADPSIPDALKAPARLQHEGTMLVLAGTESTAKTLGICTFHLLDQPILLARLRAELETCQAWPSANISSLLSLPFLNAVIAEGIRLGFGLTGRNARVATTENLAYASYVIPRGTPLSMTTLCVHTDPSVFPDPWRFDPDRWLGPTGKERQKYNLGFGKGARRCLGMHLANVEMVLVLAAIATYEMQLYETGHADVGFEHDYQVAQPRISSKGLRVTVTGSVTT